MTTPRGDPTLVNWPVAHVPTGGRPVLFDPPFLPPNEEFFLIDSTMAINIKDPETDALVRELAAVTGESITEAIKTAVHQRLVRRRGAERRRDSRERVQRLIDEARRTPVRDITEDEILGYDERGIPA